MKVYILFLICLVAANSLADAATAASKAVTRSKYMNADKPECNMQHVYEIDETIDRMLSFNKDSRPFPTNTKEMKPYCAETKALVNDVDKFILDCYKSEVQNLAKIAIFSLKRTLKNFCGKKKSKKTTKLLNAAKCMNSLRGADFDCLDVLVNKTRQLLPYKLNSEKINHICCFNVEMMKCADRKLEASTCMNPEGREAILDMIRSVTNDLTNFACGEFNESTDKCDSYTFPPKAKIDPNYKSDDKLKSFFFIAISLIESIETFDRPL